VTKDVLQLRQGESIVEQAKASAAIGLKPLAQGDLWITNQRIVWRRHGFTFPSGPDAWELDLGMVTKAVSKDLLGAFGGLSIHTHDRRYTVVPYTGILGLSIFMNGRLAGRLAWTINQRIQET
jgi:hypothetical protein